MDKCNLFFRDSLLQSVCSWTGIIYIERFRLPFGVDRITEDSTVLTSVRFVPHPIPVKHCSAQAVTLLIFCIRQQYHSKASGLKHSLRPSVGYLEHVVFTVGSHMHHLCTNSRLVLPRHCTISCCSSLGRQDNHCSYSASGTGSFSISAVCISASFLKNGHQFWKVKEIGKPGFHTITRCPPGTALMR